MTATEATTGRAVGDEVAVADLDGVRSSPAARTLGTAAPGPTIVGHQAAAASAEGVPLAVALNDA